MIKHKIIKMVTTMILTILIISSSFVCLFAGEPLDFSKYDQTGDGNTYIEDYRIMLDKILDNEEMVDESLDVNQNGVATVEDLFLLGKETDICGGIPMVPVGESYCINNAQMHVEYIDNGVTVEVISPGMGSIPGYFDYALLYDKDKLKVESIEWSKEFLEYYGEENEVGLSYFANRIKEDYVVLAGCYKPYRSCTVEKIAKITFSYVDEKKETGALNLVYHQSKYKNNLNALKENAYKITQGDTDFDNEITLLDAKWILGYALKIYSYEEDTINYLDMDGDLCFTLQDVKISLRQALHILPTQEMIVDFFND